MRFYRGGADWFATIQRAELRSPEPHRSGIRLAAAPTHLAEKRQIGIDALFPSV
jgi:hypothetical protein